MKGKCLTCGEPREDLEINQFYPFCCERCKMADLWLWLNEEVSVPVANPEIWSEDDDLER